MSKYPKAWVDAILGAREYADNLRGPKRVDKAQLAQIYLDLLSQAGALKEPPEPREFYVCKTHGSIKGCFGQGEHEWVKVREVVQDE